jgi:hypothetical protein
MVQVKGKVDGGMVVWERRRQMGRRKRRNDVQVGLARTASTICKCEKLFSVNRSEGT